jgi:hypothetical protein
LYIKKHVIGGAGIFDTIANFFKRVTGSTAAKAFASKLGSVAKTKLGNKAIEAGKKVAEEIGLKAIDVGKDVAIAKAKAFIDRATAKTPAPKNNPPVITQESNDMLASLINAGKTTNINNLLAGSGVEKAILIQDLVKKLNTGSGLRHA